MLQFVWQPLPTGDHTIPTLNQRMKGLEVFLKGLTRTQEGAFKFDVPVVFEEGASGFTVPAERVEAGTFGVGNPGNYTFPAAVQFGAPGILIEPPSLIRRTQSTGFIVISGGTGSGTGANIRLNAESHSSRANEIEFRQGSTERMRLTDRLLIGTTANGDTGAGGLRATGISQFDTAASKILLGNWRTATRAQLLLETNTNNAVDIELRNTFGGVTPGWTISSRTGSSPELIFYSYDGSSYTNRVQFDVDGVALAGLGIYRSTANSVTRLAGGDSAVNGGRVLLYGQSHSSLPSYVEVDAGGVNARFGDGGILLDSRGIIQTHRAALAASANTVFSLVPPGASTVAGAGLLIVKNYTSVSAYTSRVYLISPGHSTTLLLGETTNAAGGRPFSIAVSGLNVTLTNNHTTTATMTAMFVGLGT